MTPSDKIVSSMTSGLAFCDSSARGRGTFSFSVMSSCSAMFSEHGDGRGDGVELLFFEVDCFQYSGIVGRQIRARALTTRS